MKLVHAAGQSVVLLTLIGSSPFLHGCLALRIREMLSGLYIDSRDTMSERRPIFMFMCIECPSK